MVEQGYNCSMRERGIPLGRAGVCGGIYGVAHTIFQIRIVACFGCLPLFICCRPAARCSRMNLHNTKEYTLTAVDHQEDSQGEVRLRRY